jgi:hypothetical protein
MQTFTFIFDHGNDVRKSKYMPVDDYDYWVPAELTSDPELSWECIEADTDEVDSEMSDETESEASEEETEGLREGSAKTRIRWWRRRKTMWQKR